MTLFANRNFLLLYFITILSTFGTVVYTFVLPLIIYELSQSALAMSTMRIMDFLPNVLLGVLAGVFVDRINRNVMIRYGGLIKFILSCLMTFIIFSGDVELWHLYILGFFISTVGYTVGNASHAIIPQLFHREQMTDIQAKFSFVNTLITIIGPSIAGALLLLVAYEQLLFVYTLSLFCVWVMSTFLDATATPERPKPQSIAQDIKEGLRELFGNAQLLIPTIAILFINLATSLIIGVLVFYVIDVLGESQEQLGLMYSIGAVGGLLGAQLIKPLRKKWNRGTIFIALHLIDACALVLFFFADSWWQLGLLLAVRTCTTVMTNIIYLAIRQESTPNHLLGRVAGTSSMFMKLALPIGLFIGGIWAEVLPIPYLFLISAGIVIAIFVFMLRSNFHEVV
ncbi:MFS transporter [Chryseomicrobium palamuruense]|uniref:MFS transporter n=1 Tax=Chryseomicrobium palamuruense TaxID=682973 RepID=A0ABV8UWD1_9BACL